MLIYVLIVVLGTLLGVFINWAIYAWAWTPRAISPWSPPDAEAPPRQWTDRIPIYGWLGLRRESDLHVRRQREILRRYEPAGRNVEVPEVRIFAFVFWLRPMLIEMFYGPALALLYWWEVDQLGLIDPAVVVPAGVMVPLQQWMQVMFGGHVILATLMMVATFIDFDEKTIPDAITIPGTLLGLLLAVLGVYLFPVAMAPFALPWTRTEGGTLENIYPVLFSTPGPLGGLWTTQTGLMIGLAIYAIWCFSLANRRWIERHGFAKALRYFGAGLVKHEMLLCGFKIKVWAFLVALWLLGSAFITGVYFLGDKTAWICLLSSLVGLGIGGGQIWAVRIVARAGLGKEAMGFGDVTFMAMIGAFFGWQASVFGFFLAPFTAITIVLVAWILTGNRALPFGPYLAAASILTVVFWDRIWNQWGVGAAEVGPMIGAILAVALVLAFGILYLLRLAEDAIRGR